MSGFTPRSHVRSEGCTVVIDYTPSAPRGKDARLHIAAPEMYELLREATERALELREMEGIRLRMSELLAQIDGDG